MPIEQPSSCFPLSLPHRKHRGPDFFCRAVTSEVIGFAYFYVKRLRVTAGLRYGYGFQGLRVTLRFGPL
jgi:hypothetical protein